MSKIYKKPFKFGVLLSGLIFLFGNVVSYIPAIQNYGQCMGDEPRFPNDCIFPNWGFPFVWNDKSYAHFEEFSGILNAFVIFLSSIAVGFLFKVVLRSFSAEKLK